jgi:hypothetical protein
MTYLGLEIPYYWTRAMEHYFGLCQCFMRYQSIMYRTWRMAEEEIKKTV